MDAADPVTLSEALIRRPSVTPTDAGALDVLGNYLAKLGFKCRRLPFSQAGTPDVDNLYARYGTGAPNFCFAGHTDVVPPGDPANWLSDPFQPVRRDGRLYGRGAADMKCAIAAFAVATARFLGKTNGDFAGSISFLITGDEEGPAINGTKKLLAWAQDKGESWDACVVGEPTNPKDMGEMIKIGRRGSLNGKLTVYGTQGHTAYPHLADNPIHRLARMVDALTSAELDQGSDHFQASTLQFSTIDVGNPATNVIPARANATFNVRFNDLHTSADVEAWAREKLDGIGGDYDLDVYVSGESFLTPPGRLSEILSAAVKEVTGKDPDLSTTGGTSDARFIKDYCPVAEFGLVSQTMHKANESVAVEDMQTLTKIYLTVLENFFDQ
jgi:succinyl-diaminopimelate desuccinylase